MRNHQHQTDAPQCDSFWRLNSCAGMTRPIPTNRGGSGLHAKPLNSVIGRVFRPYRPGRTAGSHSKKKTTKKYHTCRPFCLPCWCAGKYTSASTNAEGPGLSRKPLVDASRRVWRPIVGHQTFFPVFFRVFSLSVGWRGGLDDVKTPNNNRGMTYQIDRKELSDIYEHSLRRDN